MTPFFTERITEWPIVEVIFHRGPDKNRDNEKRELNEFVSVYEKCYTLSKEKNQKYILIYDHTHYPFPDSVFRIKAQEYNKNNLSKLKDSIIVTIMIMPQLITRLTLKTFLTFGAPPFPIEIVSNRDEALKIAKKYSRI